MTTTSAASPEAQTVEVPLKDVERELNRQLKEAQGPGSAPVLRARMSNLVIYTTSAEQADEIAKEVPDIVAIHPARVFLLVNEPKPGADGVTATVTTRVGRVGTGLRAFSEQIMLRADGAAADHLPFAVRGLAIGDLPTNLWWAAPQPPVLAGSLLYDLAEQADQVIYDSFGWPQPARGMAAMASWLEKFERGYDSGHYRIASDLTWRRLKAWRRIIAQALDPASAPGALETVSEVLVEHGPHSVMQGWSLASWLSLRLGWRVKGVKVQPGVEINWHLESPGGPCEMRVRRLAEPPRGIRRVRFSCQLDGTAGALNLVPDGDRRLSILPEGVPAAPRTVTVQHPPLAELVGRQLSDRERDNVFRETMAVAQALAQSVIGS
jgi:glucose-6-phosphate dehydrogenase assembly protein OpcA